MQSAEQGIEMARKWRAAGMLRTRSAEPACTPCLNRGCCYAAKSPDGRPMPFETATARRIARLARIAIEPAELEAVAADLGRVLELADRLAAADIDGIEPMAHPHAQPLAWRADAVTEPDRASELLALAPESNGGYFLVPKVIE